MRSNRQYEIAVNRIFSAFKVLWLVMFACGISAAQIAAAAPNGFSRFQQVDSNFGGALAQLADGRWILVGGSGTLPSADIRIANDASALSDSTPLSTQLHYARAGHTATVLPNGQVLIVGGTSKDGNIVDVVELFDPVAQSIRILTNTRLFARTGHTATLLTDGRVLISGGISSEGKPLELAELWNSKSLKVDPFVAPLNIPRIDLQSALLANGQGLIWGGKDGSGQWVDIGELYDPVQRAFNEVQASDAKALPESDLITESPIFEGSLPARDAVDVAVDTQVAVRFSKALDVRSVNANTVTLIGPLGTVKGTAIGAQFGMLAFFTPTAELSPATTYTLFLNGVADAQGHQLPLTSFSFTTHRFLAGNTSNTASGVVATNFDKPQISAAQNSAAAAGFTPGAATGSVQQPSLSSTESAPDVDDNAEDWIPREENRHRSWRVLGLEHDPILHTEALQYGLLKAKGGQTAISGRVLRMNGRPLSGVVVTSGAQRSITDPNGEFLLEGISSGNVTLQVDGTAVQSEGRHYTTHFMVVNAKAGKTTEIEAPIFLPRVDPVTEVSISSPAEQEIVLTHPAMPGLEVRIPKGAVLRTNDGKIVTKVSITPIPIDRAPYPAPVDFSTYFTLQPGGAYVDGDASKAIRIVYPNYMGLAAGAAVDFWNYDPASKGWKVYGRGVVTPDGKQVTPNPGVGFRQIMTFGFGATQSTPAPPTGPNEPCIECGDPVDISTGLFLHPATDISINDVMPIELSRTYHQNDPAFHEFGLGTTLSYQMYLEYESAQVMNLVEASGTRIPFVLQSGSGDINDPSSSWKSLAPSSFQGATLVADTTKWLFYVTLKGGAKLIFSTHHNYSQLQAIRDANGNTVSLTVYCADYNGAYSDINANQGSCSGRVTQITSPNGRYIKLTYGTIYDAVGVAHTVITQAADNIGRTVNYQYDSAGRLWTVTDLDTNSESYSYDSANRMTSVTDKNGNTMVHNDSFDSANRVTQQTLADGAIWKFSYELDVSGTYIAKTTVTDPRNYVSVYNFNAAGQSTYMVLAKGMPEQKTYSMSLDSYSRVTQQTDVNNNRVTQYGYGDPYGSPTSITYLANSATPSTYWLTYDPTFHNVATITDPLTHTTKLSYDGHGNLVKATDALNHSVTLAYDGNSQGLPSSITDALNHTWQLGYTGGDLSSVTSPLSNTTRMFSDAAGRVQSVTDAFGRMTQVKYDAMDRPQQVTDPTGGVTKFGYDLNGNQTSAQDARQVAAGALGKSHVYGPDARNRTHTYTDPLGNTATYYYDGLSNVTSIIDRKGQTTSMQYDGLNRPTLITYNDQSTLTITWNDSADQIVLADSANGTITITYDDLFHIMQESGPQGVVAYHYDGAGRRDKMTVTGAGQSTSTTVTYQYYDDNRLQWVKAQQGSQTYTTSFIYDNAGRIYQVTYPNSIVATYTFNNDNTLQNISYANGATSVLSMGYTYNAIGQIISADNGTLVVPNAAIANNGYDAANRATTWNGYSQAFDNNGNLLNYAGTGVTYTWNARNQLSQSGSSSASNTLTYDAEGRMVGNTTNTTTQHTTLYDGFNSVLMDGSNFSLQGLGLDQNFARINSSGATSYLTDHLGSVRMLTDGSGNVTGQYAYGPYGTTKYVSGTDTSQFLYAGRPIAAGEYYDRNRFYMASQGRFMSQDPIGLAGGMNMYAYVGGNPVGFIDSLGLTPVTSSYSTADDAAYAALSDVAITSQVLGVEFAGSIYLNSDGTYSYSAPNMGDPTTSFPFYPNYGGCSPYKNRTRAWYHVHPYVPGYASEYFSHADIQLSNNHRYIAYLATPSSRLVEYIPVKGQDVGEFFGLGTVSSIPVSPPIPYSSGF